MSGWLIAAVCLLSAPLEAEMTNGLVMVERAALLSGGGSLGDDGRGGVASASAISVIGEPLGGLLANDALTVRAGVLGEPPPLPPGQRIIAIEGTIDDPLATVLVNGLPAAVNGTRFQAEGVQLVEGSNTITATATDPVGHATTVRSTVILDTHPPARPRAVRPPAAMTGASYRLAGTKTAGTSIWVNGVEVVALNDETTWSIDVPLVEGDNVLVIVAKDAAGNLSAGDTVTIILDNLPPVVTFTPPAKTNLNPLTVRGRVDDSRTTVTINGVSAPNVTGDWDASLPLTSGTNAIHLIAVSPNGHVTTQDETTTFGTVPRIRALVPMDGSIVYAGEPVTLQASAEDQEGDPIEYQLLLDGRPASDWSASASGTWHPSLADLGPHTLRISVRDGFGGANTAEAESLVARPPVSSPY